jgi:hypothetical protein
MSRLRLLSRRSVNPSGVDLGDVYTVLLERYSSLAVLGDKVISIALDCPLEPDCCDDLRIELESDCGFKIQVRIQVLSTANNLLIARPIG